MKIRQNAHQTIMFLRWSDRGGSSDSYKGFYVHVAYTETRNRSEDTVTTRRRHATLCFLRARKKRKHFTGSEGRSNKMRSFRGDVSPGYPGQEATQITLIPLPPPWIVSCASRVHLFPISCAVNDVRQGIRNRRWITSSKPSMGNIFYPFEKESAQGSLRVGRWSRNITEEFCLRETAWRSLRCETHAAREHREADFASMTAFEKSLPLRAPVLQRCKRMSRWIRLRILPMKQEYSASARTALRKSQSRSKRHRSNIYAFAREKNAAF